MTMEPDGSFICSRCGANVENGSIRVCSIVSDIEDEAGNLVVVNHHFCRDREEDGKKIQGCTKKVLSARNLEYYNETRESRNASRSNRSGRARQAASDG